MMTSFLMNVFILFLIDFICMTKPMFINTMKDAPTGKVGWLVRRQTCNNEQGSFPGVVKLFGDTCFPATLAFG